jgi:hypothetical protein
MRNCALGFGAAPERPIVVSRQRYPFVTAPEFPLRWPPSAAAKEPREEDRQWKTWVANPII